MRKRAAELEDDAHGLCNEISLDIFATWYALGGSQSPPTLSELITLPAWLLKDVRYIFGEIGSERTVIKRNKPKKAKTRAR